MFLFSGKGARALRPGGGGAHSPRTQPRTALAKEEYMAGEAGRSNAGLRVVKSDGEHKSVWGLRREAGVKMRDTNVGWGGRCDSIAPGAHVGVAVECLWLIYEEWGGL